MSSPTGPNITCYNYNYNTDDQYFTDNAKCPNSDSCCGATDTCLSNRLCRKTSGVLVRPSCANNPWTLESCAQICLYDNTAGFVPRVNVCPDGSYCCDNDPTCCATKSGFVLNNDGVLIGFANQTTSSTSIIPSTTLVSSTSLSISSTPIQASTTQPTSSSAGLSSQTATSNSSSGLTTGEEAGIGVGVALGVLILAALGLLLYRTRRQHTKQENSLPHYPPVYQDQSPANDYHGHSQQTYPTYAKVALEPVPSELDSTRAVGELE